ASPQMLDKALVVASLVGEGQLVNELLRFLADLAGDLDGGGALAVVPAQDDQLRTVEQVGQGNRVDLQQADVVGGGELEVGQHRIADLGVRSADLGLDVLGGANIGAQGTGLLGQLIEEGGVDVVADPKGEDARVGRVFGQGVLGDLLDVGFA